MQTQIEGVRLSPQQKHLWLLQKGEQHQPYRVQGAVLIEGNLDLVILKKALQNVVNRHEILRTTFNYLPGMELPVQVINDCYEIRCNELLETKIESIFQEMLQWHFNFEKEPPLHLSIVRFSPEKSVIVIGLAAAIADRLTPINLVCEISCFYKACLQGEEITESPMQYADIAEWQNELLEATDRETGRQYWQQQDIFSFLNYQLSFERQYLDFVFQPKFISFKIESIYCQKLAGLAHNYDTSTSVLLLTCWQILLYRLLNRSDIIVGTEFDGRKYEELESALGSFAKYLPLHCHLSSDRRFSEVLQQVKQSVEDAYRWQEYFAWDQSLNSNKNDKASSFLPFCFDFAEIPAKYPVADVEFSIIQQYTCIDRFKIKLSCVGGDNYLNAEFHYDANSFLETDIKRLAGQFQTLLESVIKNPETAISELEILTETEQQQLIVEFNNSQNDYPKDKCIHQLFESQVKQTPDNIAVVFENRKLTYRELNERANQLAHYLQQLGVKPEVLVGICVERSLDTIVGILGIIKAGGAYLPLDPTYPKERLAFVLSDTQTPVLLTQQKLVENLPEHTAKVICLDTEWETIAQQSGENPKQQVTSENLVYAIYTSGSTGKPKGVAISHRNLVQSTVARITYYQESVASFLLLSSFAFDSSIAGIFWTLCQGGMLVLPQEGVQRQPQQIAELIAQYRISHLLSLPSLYALILEEAKPQQLDSLRTVIVAGEACPKDLVKHHFEQVAETSLFNEYGPTEATVWSSVYNCSHELRTQVSIGRPIAIAQIYILDAHLKPVPLGVAGEVYIGGEGLARGYLNRPDLTAEKFIPNPFQKSGDRLYKTGDLARYLSDGNIEFLGRIDHQVKIRGFRIELGEIEALLSQHPMVRSLAVIAREDRPGNQRLVAYLVSHQGHSFSTNDLRRFLQEKLPDYMIPSAFVQLKALPLMPNGKVDIKALPAPETVRSELEIIFVPPCTRIEKLLAKIWAEVLGSDRIGIHDNFFELGGDSILSIQIVAKANQAGLQLTPKQLFERQTIAELTAVLGTTRTIEAEQGLVTGTVPLTPIQHWFFGQTLPNPHHFNQSVLLETNQEIELKLLEEVLRQLLLHHDALRLRFVLEASKWQQFLAHPDEILPITQLDLSNLPEVEQEEAIATAAAELQTTLNLSQAPLVRIALFNLGANKPNRLLFIVHHLAIDGVSWRILLEDFQTAYEQLSRGETIQLPPKTTSFKHWSEQLIKYANSAELKAELSYWVDESRQQINRLPLDYPEGENMVASARTISISLEQEETRFLLQEIPVAYQTQINDVLLAALLQAFERWTGEQKLLLDLEGHGREEIFDNIDVSRTVGWFTTIFPVLLDLSKNSCGIGVSPVFGLNFSRGLLELRDSELKNILPAVKEQLRHIPYRGIGYGLLRYLSDEIAIRKQLQALPQAEVLFNYLGQFDRAISESSLFGIAKESCGATRSLDGNRSYLLEVNAIVIEGRLQINWTYSQAIHSPTTIESLSQAFVEALRSLINGSESSFSNSQLTTILNYDAVLDSTIRPDVPVEYNPNPACIFLTGSTGFVGAFLLNELLQQSAADIYCLVRAADAISGKQRIKSNLESYSLWNDSFSNRIIAVAGDLSLPLLGLDQNEFQALASKLDVIYHNAAFINLVYPYSVVKKANVLGTQEILRLACQTKVKPVHFMSTLSVFNSMECCEGNAIWEVDNLDGVPVPDIGYVQSKWVAEKLVTTARSRGLPVCIYRLGRMSGHSQTGVGNRDDFMHRVLKGCIQLQSTPDVDVILDMTPVDYVSQVIAHLSKQKESLGKAFHICNPNPIHWCEFVSYIRLLGYPIRQIPYQDWQSELMDKWQTELLNSTKLKAENALHSLALLFSEKKAEEQTSKEPQFNCQNTLDGLADTSISCPPVSEQLLSTYFSYLIQCGFIDAPNK